MSFLSNLTIAERSGLTVAVVTLFTYLPMVGTMTSYSTVRALIQAKFNLSMTLSGLANSLAFGFTVGFSPISSSLFKKYGYKKLVLIGYGAGSLALVVCGLLAGTQNPGSLSEAQNNTTETQSSAYTQNNTETRFLPVTGEPLVGAGSETSGNSASSYVGLMFVFLYSVVFGICNNFVYNGSISMTGKHLSGSDVQCVHIYSNETNFTNLVNLIDLINLFKFLLGRVHKSKVHHFFGGTLGRFSIFFEGEAVKGIFWLKFGLIR